MPHPTTDAMRRPDGSVYHLCLRPEQLADHILLVGDPDRVARIADFFDEVSARVQHREFATVTGHWQGMPLTALSTGIGADNIEIVMQELDALAHSTDIPRSFKLLRLGTCGGLNKEDAPGTIVNSRFSIGTDAVWPYYQPGKVPPAVRVLQMALQQWQATWEQPLPVCYATACDETLAEIILTQFPQFRQSITYTGSGFYGPQGRTVGRIPITQPDLVDRLAQFEFDGFSIANIEMESAPLMAFASAMGHQAGTLATIMANRVTGELASDPQTAIDNLIEQGLEVLKTWVNASDT